MGSYIGWIDDLITILLLNGEVIHEPTGFINLVIHNQIGFIYSKLYNFTNGVNWFGLIMYAYIFIAVLNINILLLYVLAPKKLKGYLLYIFLATTLFVAFLIENVFILNYTRIGILQAFISLCSLAYIYKHSEEIKSKRYVYLYYLICFYIGLSTRPTVVLLFIPLAFLFYGIYLPRKKMLKANLALATFLFGYILFSWIIITPDQKNTVRHMVNSESYIVNILDGFNTNNTQYIDPTDSIKVEALKSWYFADQDTLLDQKFLNEFGASHPFKKKTLKDWKSNINEEIQKAKGNYTENYLPQLNWFWKSVLLISIIMLLPILFISLKIIDRKSFFKLIGYIILCFLFILAITALIKMEDRVLTPILIFILISCFMFFRQTYSKQSIAITTILAFSLLVISGFRYDDYYKISQQREADLEMKEKIRSEIKLNYSHKYVVFDLYTISLLETSPFKDIDFPDNWISGVEVWNRHKPNSAIISEIVGCQDWPCYFIEVSKRQHEFIFFFKSDRISITKDYHDLIYGIDLSFKKLSTNMLIDDFHYTFHWIPFDYGYYQLEDAQLYDTKY